MKFLLDVHVPRTIERLLTSEGHDVVHGSDRFPPRTVDEDIAAVAAQENRIIVSSDLDFASILRFPPEDAPGFIVLRPGKESLRLLTELFRGFLSSIELRSCWRRLTIVEPGRFRQYPHIDAE